MAHVGHVFHEIFLHINWHCKGDLPQIKPDMEKALYPFITEYCRKNKGVHFKCIGGTETHIHLAVQVEPFVLVSDFVGKVKGASSYHINHLFGKGALQWQRGYGVVSFAERNLGSVCKYISEQKLHHRNGTVNKTLESCGDIKE
jgi:putative transposase